MAYIGTKPTIGNFQICDAISVVNNQAAYTMQVGSVNVIPQSANHMIVSLNGTIQKPNSSYTVSGSTITFASNLATGDVIDFIQILGDVLDLGVPSDATVTTAKLADSSVTTAKLNDSAVTTAKLNDASVSLAKLTATGTKDATTFLRGDNTFNAPPLGGITQADNWRINTSLTGLSYPGADITANWERADSTGQGSNMVIGDGMSKSSGVFTFPATGIYLISTYWEVAATNHNDPYIQVQTLVTTNNSSYNAAARNGQGLTKYDTSTEINGSMSNTIIIDVADTSNTKVKFYFRVSGSNPKLVGANTEGKNGVCFVRLGDT